MKTIALMILIITAIIWIYRIYKFKQTKQSYWINITDNTDWTSTIVIFLSVYSLIAITLGLLFYLI